MDVSQSKLGIVIPVWLLQVPLLELTVQAVELIQTKAQAKLYIVLSRLKNPPLVLPEDLQTVLQHHCNVPVKVLGEPGVDRSVAACWNLGCKQAMCEGADKLMIFANDVLLKPDTIDQLLEFGEEHQDVALWSALNDRHPQKRPSTTIGDSADFSCFMLRDRTLKRHGWFDERFRPAYFEDNDYYGRIILGGERCAHPYWILMTHLHSQTVVHDKEAAHHCNYWFNINKNRFLSKWQASKLAQNTEEVLKYYSKHPWGDPKLPLSFWGRG